ncbi:Antitoxin Phd_YefM, type II toxin-antitoxin system [Acididesulfobacillus acetoxydans]|uniref:Antitoxin n=1 Tax=Acididesulfobacillus acetoxydans TaxID=1561005 RepID=A0A8S0W8Y7_9FIRM|nr:type II toxin-antitoxin system Phd/YefM family antitoxin [Acididesulfobacillus acetoxydans]CAA7602199.1 Antitoxin Phd_YefM, type II toxin-antitoxin system [Acididesulfobacillus acetoxydans]CEJ08755.1 Prevent-host-death protein [Acididesulfobacillus acetoxydans]
MVIKPTTALRTELGEITRICKEKSEPVYLTKNGEGELVVMSIAAYERREAMLNLRAKLLEAEQQRLNGTPTYTTDDVRGYIRGLHHEQA